MTTESAVNTFGTVCNAKKVLLNVSNGWETPSLYFLHPTLCCFVQFRIDFGSLFGKVLLSTAKFLLAQPQVFAAMPHIQQEHRDEQTINL